MAEKPTYAERIAADRRLVILRLLNDETGYTLNSSIIHSLINEWGYSISRDVCAADLDFLADLDLLTLNELAAGVRVAKLTSRGADVAEGRTRVTGVARPSPH